MRYTLSRLEARRSGKKLEWELNCLDYSLYSERGLHIPGRWTESRRRAPCATESTQCHILLLKLPNTSEARSWATPRSP
jgi:hypothetical protein